MKEKSVQIYSNKVRLDQALLKFLLIVFLFLLSGCNLSQPVAKEEAYPTSNTQPALEKHFTPTTQPNPKKEQAVSDDQHPLKTVDPEVQKTLESQEMDKVQQVPVNPSIAMDEMPQTSDNHNLVDTQPELDSKTISTLATWKTNNDTVFLSSTVGEGILNISGGCITLELENDEGTLSVLMVWPDTAIWNPTTQNIEITSFNETIMLEHGDWIIPGGYTPTSDNIDYVALPRPECVVDEIFIVGSVRKIDDS